MTGRKDEHIELSASKGALLWVRWLIGALIACGILGSGGVAANNLDERVVALEETVQGNTLEINGQAIKMENYTAQLLSMKDDIKETRATSERILLVLTKK